MGKAQVIVELMLVPVFTSNAALASVVSCNEKCYLKIGYAGKKSASQTLTADDPAPKSVSHPLWRRSRYLRNQSISIILHTVSE